MPISAGDILRVALQWFSDGTDEQVNVHHFEVDDVGTSGGDLGFMTQLAAMMLSELYSEVVDQIADNVLGSVITGFNVTDATTLPPVVNPVDGLASAAQGYARQVTALVYLNTGVSRRQGRSYLPSFHEGAVVDDGSWDPSTLLDIAAYAARLVDVITDGDISIHRVVTHPDGSSPLEPTFAGFAAFPRTQRRRTPGFGS
jgi:hypothetical protein